jgi:hypothetical protein
VFGFGCVIKRGLLHAVCSLSPSGTRHERQLPFLLLLVSTVSGQGLNPARWPVIDEQRKGENVYSKPRSTRTDSHDENEVHFASIPVQELGLVRGLSFEGIVHRCQAQIKSHKILCAQPLFV